uniref:UBN2 domain-containing protein n=1 Tax=Glycine max TaxID=3847 RepID=A0A0R0KGD3_SOYBN
MAHFESIHIDLWDVIEHGNYIPLDDQLNEIPRTSWTDAQRQSYRSAKQKWDKLALTYEGSPQVKCNKLNLLTYKYELFTMEDGEDIQAIFGRFQTILIELCCLNRIFVNYDNIDKILRSLSRKWRPQVIPLKTMKNLDSMSIEELIGTLKIQEQELQQDERFKKAINIGTPSDDESNDEGSDEDDQLAFISRKKRNMWKKRNESN